MGAPVSWFDFTARDTKATGEFYTQLFGWTLNDSGDGAYWLVDTHAGDGAIGGGIGALQGPGDAPSTTVYMRVDDLGATLDRAVSLGGAVVVPPTPLPGDYGSFAMFSDPEGRVVGLMG